MYIQNFGPVSWIQLKCAMSERFQDRRTDYDIRRSLDVRKQKHGENFLEFYNTLLTMAIPLKTPLKEPDLFNIIKRNMRSGLQIATAANKFRNLSELVNVCVAHEDTWERTGYNPEAACHPRRYINEIYDHNVVMNSQKPNFIQ